MDRKREYKNIKVKPETYRRLRIYKNRMELKALEKGEEERFSMDRVVGALLDFLEAAEIKIDGEAEEESAYTLERAT